MTCGSGTCNPRRIGPSIAYITKLVNKGTLELINGKLDLVKSIRIIAQLENKGGENGGGNTNGKQKKQGTLFEEQARHTRIKADIADLELKEKEGNLVDVDHALSEFGKLAGAVCPRFLGIPTKLAPRLAHKTAAVIKPILEDEIHKALYEFGKYNPDTGKCEPKET